MSMFVREDWTLFRSLNTLSQKAGVPASRIRRLVLKELMDNALDAGGDVEDVDFGREGGNTYWVTDGGYGIQESVDIADLFSVKRPLSSSKLLRLPTRGALGNGLRVVVGAVLATGGDLTVETRGMRYKLKPQDDGSTTILEEGTNPLPSCGTKITVHFGSGLPSDYNDTDWAAKAHKFRMAKIYKGKTSAWWYDGDSFYELLRAAGSMKLGDLLKNFGAEAPGNDTNRVCETHSRQEASDLLIFLRNGSAEVPPKLLGCVGGKKSEPYHKEEGTIDVGTGRGAIQAKIPFVVEAWATPLPDQSADTEDEVEAYVNGTPITGQIRVNRQGAAKLGFFGCGLRHLVDNVSRKKTKLVFNVTIPHMPITTDGKEPDFERLIGPIGTCVSKATKKMKSLQRRGMHSQKDIVFRRMSEAVKKASGNGKYRFSQRQLYYVVRAFILEDERLENNDMTFENFTRILTTYENDMGEIRGVTRDPRGNLYIPHLRRTVPIGTIAVEEYDHPTWTFSRVLYCEKEGFTNLLIADGWPERYDCALLSSKGFASRAVRDLLDLIGEKGEDIRFFCVHDADASGGLIYQALQEGTAARPMRRNVEIINLGLEPWEALQMHLQVEKFEVKGKRKLPIADHVRDYGVTPDDLGENETSWSGWLNGKRVELNAMTSPQFIAWLDDKMAAQGETAKLVAPRNVVEKNLEKQFQEQLKHYLAEEILLKAGFDKKVQDGLLLSSEVFNGVDAEKAAAERLENNPSERWTDPIKSLAIAAAKKAVEKLEIQ